MLEFDFLEFIFWRIGLYFSDLELVEFLFFGNGIKYLNYLDFYFLEVDPAELWVASALGRGNLFSVQ